MLNTLKCYMDIAAHRPSVHYRGNELEPYDAVIPRIGASVTFYGAAVLRQFEMMGAYPLNESVAITRSRDKLRSLQIMARAGIGLPLTGFANSPDDTKDMIKLVGGAPLVVKLLEGTQGKGVVLAETHKAAESLIDAFRNLDANFLVQEFIKEAGGAGHTLPCDRDEGSGGDEAAGERRRVFAPTCTAAARPSLIRLTPEERSTAVRAAKEDGIERCRCRSAAVEPRPGGAGSEFVAGTSGNRNGHR